MDYQKELVCIRCDSVGSIRKIKVHNVDTPNDECVWFVCTNCKGYASSVEALTANWDDFPFLLSEYWEWVDEGFLDEECKEMTLDEYLEEKRKAEEKAKADSEAKK